MAIVQLPPDRRTARPRADRALVRLAGSLSLVLPAHNEEGNIELVVEDAVAVLPRFVDDFEIIVVDDGSRDATAASPKNWLAGIRPYASFTTLRTEAMALPSPPVFVLPHVIMSCLWTPTASSTSTT